MSKINHTLADSVTALVAALDPKKLPEHVRGTYLFVKASMDYRALDQALELLARTTDEDRQKVILRRVSAIYDRLYSASGFVDVTEVGADFNLKVARIKLGIPEPSQQFTIHPSTPVDFGKPRQVSFGDVVGWLWEFD